MNSLSACTQHWSPQARQCRAALPLVTMSGGVGQVVSWWVFRGLSPYEPPPDHSASRFIDHQTVGVIFMTSAPGASDCPTSVPFQWPEGPEHEGMRGQHGLGAWSSRAVQTRRSSTFNWWAVNGRAPLDRTGSPEDASVAEALPTPLARRGERQLQSSGSGTTCNPGGLAGTMGHPVEACPGRLRHWLRRPQAGRGGRLTLPIPPFL